MLTYISVGKQLYNDDKEMNDYFTGDYLYDF